MTDREMRRKRAAKAARERRRRRRRRAVIAGRILVAVAAIAVLAGGGLLIWNSRPEMKLKRNLDAAGEYAETKEYEEALASCEEALKIDDHSVRAYKVMSDIYLSQEDRSSAEKVLYEGWETTQDESLLQEYCIHLMNDAVAQINSGDCSLDTLETLVHAVELNAESADIYRLFDACYERIFEAEDSELFCEETEGGSCGFMQYYDLMLRLMKAYESHPADGLREKIGKYAVPGKEVTWLEVRHLKDYQELLKQILAIGVGGEAEQMAACLDKALWVQDTFAEAFAIFESKEFEPIKEFMQSETYVSIRDQFIGGTMEYWKGETYIPVSRERMKLIKDEEGWKFAFADFKEYEQNAGVVKVWGAKQEDAGVQRLCISYEPPSETGEYYPHTTYEFVYLYSNVKIRGDYVPQMNYRFETRIATPEGTTSNLVGDWGGEHEWTTEY